MSEQTTHAVPSHLTDLVEEILSFTRVSFPAEQNFEFEIQAQEDGSVFLFGPYGTFLIALEAKLAGTEGQLVDLISVNLDSDPGFVSAVTHGYANKFKLDFGAPHAVDPRSGQVVFEQAAYDVKVFIDETRLRGKIAELTQEAVVQESERLKEEAQKPAIIGLDGRAL